MLRRESLPSPSKTNDYCQESLKSTDLKKMRNARAAEKVEGIKRAALYCHGHNMEENMNKMATKRISPKTPSKRKN